MPASHPPLGVAVIGCGNFARHQHIPNLARIPECRLLALCDVQLDVVAPLASRYDVPLVTDDYRRVLDDPAVDAVVIAVRDDLQAIFSAAALQAGKHVYVEKPLAKTPDACANVVSALASSGRRLAVGFNRRYAPAYRRAREVVAVHGGARNIHMHMVDDAWRWAKNYPPGFLLYLDAGHHFDLLRWLTGAEVASVYCLSSRPDDYSLALRMSDGATATYTLSGHGSMDMPKERLEIIAEHGGIMVDDFVTLHTYGFADAPHTQSWAGHSHPEGEFLHLPLMAHQGARALADLRRVTWEMREHVAAHPDDDSPYAAEMRAFAARTVPNFLRPQGWMEALRAFLVGVQTGAPTDHASAPDALAAALVTAAAQRSLQSASPETPSL